MPKYRNMRKMPVSFDLPGRSVSVPGRGVIELSDRESSCSVMVGMVARGLLFQVPEPEKAEEPVVEKPKVEPKPEPVVEAILPPAPVVSEELVLPDFPGQPTAVSVAPSDDQPVEEDVAEEPGEGATEKKSKSRRRKKKS